MNDQEWQVQPPTWALEQLHEQTYHDFVVRIRDSASSRMPRFRPGMVELEP